MCNLLSLITPQAEIRTSIGVSTDKMEGRFTTRNL